MKKHICMIMLITIILNFYGCSNNTTINSELSNSEITEATSVETEKGNTNQITFTTPYEIIECYMGYFIATTNDGRLYGMLDSKGNVVLDFIYDSLSFGSTDSVKRENVIYASTENGSGVIDFKGNIVIPFEYHEIKEYNKYCNYTFARSFEDIYIISEDNKKTKLNMPIHRNDMNFIEPLGNNCFGVTESGTVGAVYNFQGEKIASYSGLLPLWERVSEKYICIQETIYSENDNKYISKMNFYDSDFNLCVSIDDKFTSNSFAIEGYVSEDIGVGTLKNKHQVLVEYPTGLIISNEYENTNSQDGIGDFYNGKAFARGPESFVVIDSNGSEIKSIDTKYGDFATGVAVISNKSDSYRLYDLDGNDIFNERFYDVEILTNDYMLVENLDGNTALINRYGKVMYDFGTIAENTIYGYEKKIELLNKDMYCAVVDNGENNTVYAFIN